MSTTPPRILIVDDEPTSLLTLQAILSRAGYDVVTLKDPRKALTLAETVHPDAMIVDIVMPEMSGWELLEKVRSQQRFDPMPVLVLSSLELPADRVRALRLGAEDFIVKPYDADEIVARIEGHLARRMSGGLHGVLAVQPIHELVQSLENNRQTGELHVYADGLAGTISVRDGKAVAAEWVGFREAFAVQTILELDRGEYRFAPAREMRLAPDHEPLSFFPILMHVAWLADELAARREHLPPAKMPLEVISDALDGSGTLRTVPDREVYEYLQAHPGTSLERLIQEQLHTPQSLRLAVASLAERGMIGVASSTADFDDISKPLLDLLGGFLLAAATHGIGSDLQEGDPQEGDPLELIFLVESQSWDTLAPLLLDIDENLLPMEQRVTRGEIYVDQGGVLNLGNDESQLTLSFYELGEKPETLPTAAGIVLWLGEATLTDPAIIGIPQRNLLTDGAAMLCVTPDKRTQRYIRQWLGPDAGWDVLADYPKTLGELLMLLRFGDMNGS